MHRRVKGSLVLLPVLLIVIFLGAEVLGSLFGAREEATDLNMRMTEVDQIGDAIHELQRERGLSSGFLASGGQSLGGALRDQRLRSDRALEQLRTALARADQGRNPADLLGQLRDLRGWREGTDTQRLTQADVVAQYTGLVRALLDASHVVPASMTVEDQLNYLSNALQAISLAKEAAGLQRATGAAGLGLGRFDGELHRLFITRGAQHDGFLDLADVHLRAAELPHYLERGVVAAELVEMQRDFIQNGYRRQDFGDTSPEEWFATSTAWINALRYTELRITERMVGLTEMAEQDTRMATITSGLAVILALLLVAIQLLMPEARRVDTNIYDGALDRVG